MTLSYVVRPISDRTQFTGPPWTGSRNPFDASWAATEDLLLRELDHLGASKVVVEMDVSESDIRIDGRVRATARPSSPGVRLAFETPEGPMVFATDRFGWNYNDQPIANGWQQNVRAIALGLEALRKVDRYGITSRREQYRGFRALPAGQGIAPTGMTTDVALKVVAEETGIADPGRDAGTLREALRTARALSHPDRNDGDRSRWNAVDEAEQVLRRAGRL